MLILFLATTMLGWFIISIVRIAQPAAVLGIGIPVIVVLLFELAMCFFHRLGILLAWASRTIWFGFGCSGDPPQNA